MNSKQKLIAAVVAIGAVLIGIFYFGFYSKSADIGDAGTEQTENNSQGFVKELDVRDRKTGEVTKIKLLSTNPSPLNEATILPTQTIELTFSEPLENTGEFKHRLEPESEYELKLSGDRKTIQIIPKKPFTLGVEHNLFILPDSKFDGKILQTDFQFRFSTIGYKGV